MIASPRAKGFAYAMMGTMFFYFAILHVETSSWDFFAYAFLAIASADYIIAWRFFRKSANEKEEENKKTQ